MFQPNEVASPANIMSEVTSQIDSMNESKTESVKSATAIDSVKKILSQNYFAPLITIIITVILTGFILYNSNYALGVKVTASLLALIQGWVVYGSYNKMKNA